MATPERHDMVLDVLMDILELLASDDEVAKNFKNVLFVKYNINTIDVERSKELVENLRDLFEGQLF